MCIIAAKPANVKMPSMEQLKIMWENNPDGAGIMYAKNNKVQISKGFMTWEEYEAFMKKLQKREELDKLSVIMHFRIKTHGAINPECTHPFPLTDSIAKLGKREIKCNIGVAHNGIIDITPRKGLSDTMEYIVSQLDPLNKALPTFLKNKHALQMIANAIESKMAFLTSKGEITLIGEFEEKNGIKYSNHSYVEYKRYYGSYFTGDDWMNYEEDAMWGFKRKVRKLMPIYLLKEDLYYGDTEESKLTSAEKMDIAIDSEANAYMYIDDYDAYEDYNEKIYLKDGSRAPFIPEEAAAEWVADWNY